MHPLWWALAIGADFGGNLTLVGASTMRAPLRSTPFNPPTLFTELPVRCEPVEKLDPGTLMAP